MKTHPPAINALLLLACTVNYWQSLRNVLQNGFATSNLNASFKTNSGSRTRYFSGFFVPNEKGSQSFSFSAKCHNQIKYWYCLMVVFYLWGSTKVYGRVDEAQYNTRKGNKPSRLLAESNTRSPSFSKLVVLELKLTGVTQ